LLYNLKNVYFLIQFPDPDLQLLDIPLRSAISAAAEAQATTPTFAVLFKHPLSEICRPS